MAEIKIATLKDEDGSYGGLCSCGYSSKGWPKQNIAAERIGQHFQEHQDGTLMEDIESFRIKRGLVPDGSLAVFPEGAREVKVEDDS